MLVEFHPQFNSQETDQTHYNLVPWSGKVASQSYSSNYLDQNTSRLETSKAEAWDPDRAVEVRAAKCCTWKECPTTLPFANDADLELHLKSHAEDVIQRLSNDGSCTWSGYSKAKFKLSALKLHLQNVHVKPLICGHPGCSYKRPFRNISDLQRHVHTKHSQTGVFRCPYKECRSSTRTFKRKDKWLKHVEDAQHQLDKFCPVQHCWIGARGGSVNFENPKEVVKHMLDAHGGTSDQVRHFSCAIGGCEVGDPPFLTKHQLMSHLMLHHHFGFAMTQLVVDAVETTEGHQLQLAHLQAVQ
ncbi:hypothetical protein NA56DRAFT_454081 [Hyaloscypha hepaticicola]|uniref:C2H2-type domain-containing protein n=1 Tax=Hyaloscypha hepaticicola TaxID=2082293 RepID=A0A2J6PFP8_9HELO|nr:hypothetical protein NA56DRAFT_454081 [Hyaloscypha hepaticicola]